MGEIETVEVPFVTVGNRRALTDMQIVADPYLRHFLHRFRSCFERDEHLAVWLYIETPDPLPEKPRGEG